MESGRPGADSGVGGDPCVPNEKSPKLGPCPPAGGLPVRPLAIRHGVRAGQLPFDTPRGQGAPSTIRCIKTPLAWYPLRCRLPACQGAPSTIRCIKTRSTSTTTRARPRSVREHPAPSGALRHQKRRCQPRSPQNVREHPAPSGALRLAAGLCGGGAEFVCQGAPSTIRCIKTQGRQRHSQR